MGGLLNPPGEEIPQESLRSLKARSLVDSLNRGDITYATLIECRAESEADVVIMDIEVEVSQLPVNPINPSERVAVIFELKDEKVPEVFALRSDFPKVPHLNLRDEEFPRSLCLYEEAYRDLKRRWTAPRFIERIRDWLALTARGELHQGDQPLEPLLYGHVGHIILPHNLLTSKEPDLPKRLYLTASDGYFFIAYAEKPQVGNNVPIAVSLHQCHPQEHGIIYRRPSSLTELSEFLHGISFDLLSELCERLKTWWEADTLDAEVRKAPLVLVFVFPKQRARDKEPESNDIWTFITSESVEKVGEEIGIWTQSGGHLCPLVPVDSTKKGETIKLDLLNSSFALTRKAAAKLNGQAEIKAISISAIGVGALGSQVVLNLARSGFGNWTLIDNDRLMPHNVCRHALSSHHIGYEKSLTLSFEVNSLLQDEDIASFIPADVLDPGENADKLAEVFKQSDTILDMSASVTVARFLAHNVESSARRISLFLTPTGNDLVLLAESDNREARLDEIEMQYYRLISEDDNLLDHLKSPEARTRYGRSCRDVTSTLPQDLVGLHAAIGARAIREVTSSKQSRIIIWKSDNLGNVKRIEKSPVPVYRHQVGKWTVCIDEFLLFKLSQIRNVRLPNETGGVLLGSFDLERNIIYIVETIASPPDSQEWPMLYIRGCQGLSQMIENVKRNTAGMIEYIGDWHSHPNGYSTAPSQDDVQVFSWLSDLMSRDGLPALMMIFGEQGRISCFVSQIEPSEMLLPLSNVKA